MVYVFLLGVAILLAPFLVVMQLCLEQGWKELVLYCKGRRKEKY